MFRFKTLRIYLSRRGENFMTPDFLHTSQGCWIIRGHEVLLASPEDAGDVIISVSAALAVGNLKMKKEKKRET